ncbi:MAG: Uma2 family endonuclease [Verrucomicrobiota bacterium]
MIEPYEEVIQGEKTLRLPPTPRHELICGRLHAALQAGVANFASTKLLEIRSSIFLGSGNEFCPDLALMTAANSKLWLAVEVVNSGDHQADTVLKKEVYEAARIPRLWMVDPRYDNVEVYYATTYGLRLQEILATRDVLTEKLLPEFQMALPDLFAPANG